MTEEYYTKNRLAQLAIAIGLILTFAGLLLLIQSVSATTIVQNQGTTASTILTLRAICIENSGIWNDYYCGFTNQQNKQNFEQRIISKGLADEYQFLGTPTMGFNTGGRDTIIIKEDNDNDDNDNDGLDRDDVKDVLKKQCKKEGKEWFKGKCMTKDEKAVEEDDICDNENAATTRIDMCKSDEDEKEEGKRYVNPDGGAPLYPDELTEDEKDVYTEYKPEKEEDGSLYTDGTKMDESDPQFEYNNEDGGGNNNQEEEEYEEPEEEEESEEEDDGGGDEEESDDSGGGDEE